MVHRIIEGRTVEEIEDLIFFRQEIYDNKLLSGVKEYELLLRLKIDGEYRFPKILFEEILSNREFHKIYIKKLERMLNDITIKDNAVYNINLDYQELYFEETLKFLNDFKMKTRVKIELTEKPPTYFYDNECSLIPVEKIKYIKELGYSIALDDFLTGINNIDTFLMLKPYIDRIKISTLFFKKYVVENSLKYLFPSIIKILNSVDKEIVIEGIENEYFISYLPKDWKQQTYLFNKPHNF